MDALFCLRFHGIVLGRVGGCRHIGTIERADSKLCAELPLTSQGQGRNFNEDIRCAVEQIRSVQLPMPDFDALKNAFDRLANWCQ